MVSRMLNKTKGRFFFFLIILVVSVSIVYLYLMHIQENFKNIQWSEKRCLSELTSVKSQLNVVTEYKNRIEKVLSDTQKSHKADKDKFKDVMENLNSMKQQSDMCQSQFDDVQTECKKCRELYKEENRELLQLKDLYAELQKAHEKLQNSIKDQYSYIDTLRNENTRLQDSLRQAQAVSSNFEQTIRHYNNKSFAHQLEVSDGVYKIDIKNNMKAEMNNEIPRKRVEEKPVDKSSQLKPPYKMNVENKENKNGEAVPPGFPPVLSVLETVNSNLPKPLEVAEKSNDRNKQDDMFKMDIEHKQQAINDPAINKVDAFESNANMHMIDIKDINDGIKIIDKDLNVADQNQNMEEDEDDGEEYPT